MIREQGIFWKTAPFIRLLPALIAGILCAYYLQAGWLICICLLLASAVVLILYRLLPIEKRYAFRPLAGTAIQLLLFTTGILLVCVRQKHDPRKNYTRGMPVLVTLTENALEKARSYKATADLHAFYRDGKWVAEEGKIILYFKKDSTPVLPAMGTKLILYAPLQQVPETGNPGMFDYREYCRMQHIFFQAFINPKDYTVLPGNEAGWFQQCLYRLQQYILGCLKKYLPGPKEAGVAEALLIGYRNDLDKTLLQSYSNTGVVHIIAISGMHLAMIYGMLVCLSNFAGRRKWVLIVKSLVILFILWGFSLLAGAGASILRAAVMFSFIIAGEGLNRKSNTFNTLAASAFFLLLYNPYYLWDTGFQLSYAAVLSILLFQKPIYRCITCRNKLLDLICQLNAVTLAAQVLTLPLLLYYFHQFPNLFLLSNFFAVPLSGLVLYGSMLLLVLAPVPVLNTILGRCIGILVQAMNGIIGRTDRIPYAVTGNISISFLQQLLLYSFTGAIAYWLWYKNRLSFLMAIAAITVFCGLDCYYSFRRDRQRILVVYNLPRQSLSDIYIGRFYHCFAGDLAEKNTAAYSSANTALTASRILHGVGPAGDALTGLRFSNEVLTIGGKSILYLAEPPGKPYPAKPVPVDMIILRSNPRVRIAELTAFFDCKMYVFDSSNPLWKIGFWKKEADSLHLRHHSIPEQGALVMAL
ncbi:ComEC/Rec2 family competence protein [Sediminibacterium ginsengisoli]|uniref:Competence protein ComEC n=1 Tax=Sediminibacterium ginsengisoli TaxID=413434 RepID=A0A1T4JTS3_9BACT|nr:ComEC/Rec2 family competence protein [Sediminibacterium ginsengisoli]SJZ33612.1 competence protein ComEC [Sediminibacterium ginsengisoli]